MPPRSAHKKHAEPEAIPESPREVGSLHSESDSEDDLMLVKKRPKKKPKHMDPAAFADAMSSILGADLAPSDEKVPILARNKLVERKIKADSKEVAARKALAMERKRLASRDRIIPDFSNATYEKSLRKVATRGVVKLFNAIATQQKELDLSGLAPDETDNKVKQMSKDSFLSLLKSGGTE
ncbi:pre-60S ribosomal particles component [Tieghemiomyces parasiticus]|uniref:Pre-60S ribosomal particles component n=1 Tax=Tieghemiomyces parasiticus TaxID=78921 RepID=A0A9W7ZXK6_9FUNG|nr:pre-60S ribosomal particles component [Tieghemiomyces parasiticus]